MKGTWVRKDVFTYTVPGHGVIVWDITRARAFIEAGRFIAEVPIDVEQMGEIMRKNEWDEDHLADVDPTQPGIGAPMFWAAETIYILIDGTHRCVRALREGKVFRAKLLSDAAAEQCVVSGPPELLPWKNAT